MEYVEGLDLARIVRAKGPLPVDRACYFAHQAALALQHAHEEGMVHRDIKPGNLMLSHTKGRPVIKILDFGLAKANRELHALDDHHSSDDVAEVPGEQLTRAGQLLGTPEFIAPEQIDNAQHADTRADIYSLGCTLYYLLSGSTPFPRTNVIAVVLAHRTMSATPLNEMRDEVPAELAAVVAKMMAKAPGDRFQTPDEVAKALAPFFKKVPETNAATLIGVMSAATSDQGLAATQSSSPIRVAVSRGDRRRARPRNHQARRDLGKTDRVQRFARRCAEPICRHPIVGESTPLAPTYGRGHRGTRGHGHPAGRGSHHGRRA